MVKCISCGTEVVPVKSKFSLKWCRFVPFYLFYHWFGKQPVMCPVCDRNVYTGKGVKEWRGLLYGGWTGDKRPRRRWKGLLRGGWEEEKKTK